MLTYKFRLCPTKKQVSLLNKKLEICRRTYNKGLQYKIDQYKNYRKLVTEFDMNKKVIEWRNSTDPWMQDCELALLHTINRKIEHAFKGFYKRLKSKNGKAGFPRFKGKGRWRSLMNSRFVFNVKKGKVRLMNSLGWVKIKNHRDIDGKTAGYTITKNSCGQWFLNVFVENTFKAKLPQEKAVKLPIGLDLGCTNSVTLSDGVTYKNPKNYKRQEKQLSKAQRNKKYKVAAKISLKIANRRADFNHKLSKDVVRKYDFIAAEKIEIAKNLDKNTYKQVRKSIRDAGWNQIINMIAYKAEKAGKTFVLVNPAYTSQMCSKCEHINSIKLSERHFTCPNCNHSESRDMNAAKNILRRGLSSLASA